MLHVLFVIKEVLFKIKHDPYLYLKHDQQLNEGLSRFQGFRPTMVYFYNKDSLESKGNRTMS